MSRRLHPLEDHAAKAAGKNNFSEKCYFFKKFEAGEVLEVGMVPELEVFSRVRLVPKMEVVPEVGKFSRTQTSQETCQTPPTS